MRFLDPDKKKGKAFTGYLWLMGRPGGYVIFKWSCGRKNAAAFDLLKGFGGLLQSDGYASYEAFAKVNSAVKRAGCWAHARRAFFEAAKEDPAAVNLVLRLIGHLYAYEREWKRRKTNGPVLRTALRAGHFGQSLTLLQKVARKLQERSRPSSGIGEACTYLLNQWPHLIAAVENGQCELDNNLIENAVRPTAVGKKNWLFIGSPDAGARTAIIYSVLITCRRFGIEPLAYLRDVLNRLPAMSNQDNLDALLPDRWKPPSRA